MERYKIKIKTPQYKVDYSTKKVSCKIYSSTEIGLDGVNIGIADWDGNHTTLNKAKKEARAKAERNMYEGASKAIEKSLKLLDNYIRKLNSTKEFLNKMATHQIEYITKTF